METFKLNKDFMFGTATASTQIEGGDRSNMWFKWSEEGHISDSSSSITGCDHWNRVEQDTELLKTLGVQTHRMSLEWSRIEPSPRVFAPGALNHYRNEIQLLLENDIKPVITLHHFSDPIWFHDRGGWSKPENIELFIEYARYVVENLGDLVTDWITFNEPNVYIMFGYQLGLYPPGKKGLKEAFKVKAEIIKTHVGLYDLIHRIRTENGFKGKTMVGAAMHLRIFDGLTWVGKCIARAADYFFNRQFMEGLTTGHLQFPLPCRDYRNRRGQYADFLGINYYTRNIVEFAWDPTLYFHKLVTDKGLNKSDLGWDIYPEGIYRVCKTYYDKYRLPIYITENGISDKLDNRRPDFIIDHLAYLAKAVQEGVPIERYYHWTLMDNFEWLEGESANFGLYHNDFRTQERTPRRSAYLYAQLCRTKEVTRQMLDEYTY